ncbi:hypothetical protein BCR33DRAFT_660644, partial [Rhizoclosmatium globosum]
PSTQHHAITALPFPPLYSTPIIPPFNPTPRHNCAALSTVHPPGSSNIYSNKPISTLHSLHQLIKQ